MERLGCSLRLELGLGLGISFFVLQITQIEKAGHGMPCPYTLLPSHCQAENVAVRL